VVLARPNGEREHRRGQSDRRESGQDLLPCEVVEDQRPRRSMRYVTGLSGAAAFISLVGMSRAA
jgi:hypothetical protein